MRQCWNKAKEKCVLRFFGKERLRPGQADVIAHALSGRNTLALLPTGYGKSLCYQAAAYLLGGTSLVVSPLLALMREQVDTLLEIGIPARRFDSTLDETERVRTLEELEAGEARLLYVAPESLENNALEKALDAVSLRCLIVDEAHCLSQWGHSFRPDYLRLPDWAAKRKFFCTMAFTATATPRVQKDLCEAFNIAPDCVVSVSPYRSNIRRCVRASTDASADAKVYLLSAERRPAIVYTRTRKGAELLAEQLTQAGLRAECYHAGMPPANRELIQQNFLRNQTEILVATIAFGMGVDKADVRSVVHVNMPSSPEAYLQESGRAGRDGLPAESLVLLVGSDRVEARNRIRASEPDAEGLLRCVRSLLPASEKIVSLRELSSQCDMAEDVPRRVLDFLVNKGATRVLSECFQFYKLRPLFPLTSILSGRERKEKERLQWLHEHRKGEVEEAAAAWECSCAEAQEQMEECSASGEWELQLQRRALVICPGNVPLCAREAAEELQEFYVQRTQQDLRRLETLEEMLCSPSCLNSSLESYLTGAPLPHACGICSSCCDATPTLPPFPEDAPLPPPAAELPEFERDGQRRRFLAGCISPWLLSHRFYAHPLYGSCRSTPWDEL